MPILARLIQADEHWTERLCIAARPGPLRSLAMFLAHSGDSWFLAIGLAIILLLGNDAWKQRALVLFFGILGTAVIVLILKWAFRRSRPEGDWGKIYRKTDPHSFPSGHAARAGLLLGLGIWVGPVWFTIALLVYSPLMAFARIVMGVHYLSDVVVGYLLGFAISMAIGRALDPPMFQTFGGWLLAASS